MRLTDRSVSDLLTAFSSTDPTPGGGSASALASAVGASLLLMVAGLPKTRNGSDEDRAALAAAARRLDGLRADLTAAIDADAAAYDRVVAAYKLPKATADDKVVRQAAVQQAMHTATEVPLGVLRLSAAALVEAIAVAAHGHRAAASDVGVAVALLRAGARGARLNVEINTGSLTDIADAGAITAATNQVSEEAAKAADRADAMLSA